MAIQILQKGKMVREEYYGLSFNYLDMPSAGYLFDCDKDGKLINPTEEQLANANACRKEVGKVYYPPVVMTFQRKYYDPAVGQCYCGKKVYLTDPLDNYCECGRCYNMCGQEVIPSSQCDEQGEPYGDY